MEQSCSKSDSAPPPPLPPTVTRYQFAQYHPDSGIVEIRPEGAEADGPLYRRNDPTNRSYRMRKRMPAQVYHCVQCNKDIKYPSKISEHIRKHTGEKPHSCPVCGHSFSQGHTLKTHMQQHMNEKPYKCSYCTAVFYFVSDKNDHEAQHMHQDQPESMEDDCPPFLQDAQEPEDPIVHAEEVFYACPLSCGFQNPVEAVVVEHFQLDHDDHEKRRYVNECWEEQTDPVEEVVQHVHSERKARLGTIPIQDAMIAPEYTEEPDQIFEYYDHQYVGQGTSEVIAEPAEAGPDQPCSSNSYDICYDPQESSAQESLPLPRKFELVFEGEEDEQHVAEGLDHIEKKIIIPDGQEIKQVVPNHIYEEFPMDDHDLEAQVEDVGLVNEEEEEQERVRVIVNPNPPKRGTKSLRDHHEASAAMREMVVDAATLEMAAPSRNVRRGYLREMRKKKVREAQNLDWIIDAVAKGVDVNEASPHHRKKPTMHKCEFCGKVDKYPSKIRAHMRTHTGEKPFKCDICGMAFSQRTPMRLHLRRHFDQKPYECDVVGCKERFVSGAILKMHFEKKHLNKKKYVCSRGCGRVFSSAYNQRHHETKCSQNTYLTWVEENESGEETMVEYPEDEEEYIDDMMDPSTSEPKIAGEHFAEEPVFLHP